MASFNWGKPFVTGLPEVDIQHQHLVKLINKFGTLLTDNDVHIEDVDSLYRQLSDYAIYHFHEEEKLMHNIKVDSHHISSHVHSHKRFLDEISSIYSNITRENIEQSSSLLKFLTHWLVFHILGQDQDMAKQVKAIQSGMKPSEAFDSLKNEKNESSEPLVEALNGLFELVSLRNHELKRLNESLEAKVEIRTKELFKANQRLNEMSLTDELTELPNRRHAMRYLSDIWDDPSLEGSTLSCIMIDADNFKEINDTYGHDAGDLVLKTLAKELRQSFRTDDLVCRLGGDEFFVICPNTNKDDAYYIAEQARNNISKLRVPTEGEPWFGSISVGLATRTPEMNEYSDIIKAADEGVYLAKSSGRNCVKKI